ALELRQRMLRPGLISRLAQPGVDLAGSSLAVADADGHGALRRHHVASGEHPWATRHQRARHADRSIAVELHPGHIAQEGRVALLAEREDDGIRRQGLETAGRLRVAGLVELHFLDLQLGALERLDRAQPVDAYSLR